MIWYGPGVLLPSSLGPSLIILSLSGISNPNRWLISVWVIRADDAFASTTENFFVWPHKKFPPFTLPPTSPSLSPSPPSSTPGFSSCLLLVCEDLNFLALIPRDQRIGCHCTPRELPTIIFLITVRIQKSFIFKMLIKISLENHPNRLNRFICQNYYYEHVDQYDRKDFEKCLSSKY